MPTVNYSKYLKILKIAGHGSLILFFCGFPFYVFYATGSPHKHGNPLKLPVIWWFFTSYLTFFYGYTYYIIPRLLLRKHHLGFLAAVIFLLLIFYFGRPFQFMFDDFLFRLQGRKIPPYDPNSFDILSIVLFALLAALGLAIQVIRQWQLTEKRALQAETDKAMAELSFLKTQINPHFLFNALHTIYSLILTKNELAGDSVLKLSNIMRYVTDYGTEDFVPLEMEISSLTDYIELQKLQHGKKVKLDFSVTGNSKNKQIAPLILMTYLENAFKYGISNHDIAPITIRLDITENQIDFFCQNRIFATPRVIERTGIGLLNTKKRLDYFYPEKHDLNIASTTELYTVTLTLLLV